MSGAATGTRVSRPCRGDRAQTLFLGVCALLFVASTWLTIEWASSMTAMNDMPMAGGWTMSMTWMRMPGQSWTGAAASFLGMWSVMMVAMMLPSLVPMLAGFRSAIGATGRPRWNMLTAVAGTSYFLIWSLLGALVYPLGASMATLAMQHPALSRAMPLATGMVVLLASVLQLSPWKARHLACCSSLSPHQRAASADITGAARYGATLASHCIACCAGPLAVLIVAGLMDLRAMALVTVLITLERMVPAGERLAKASGLVGTMIGLVLVLRAMT